MYHRASGAEVYEETFSLDEAESADSMVVPLAAPIVVGVVTRWTKHGDTWGGSRLRVVSARLDVAQPEATTHSWHGEPWSLVSALLGITPDGTTVYCVANAPEPVAA